MDNASMETIAAQIEKADHVCLVTFKDDKFDIFATFERTDQLLNFLLLATETLLYSAQEEERKSLTEYAQNETMKLLNRIDKKIH